MSVSDDGDHRSPTFPRSARLLSRADYERVFDGAERLSNRDFTLLCANRPGLPGRLGLAVSKRQLRRAVDRNRCKRLIRETYRHRRHALAGRDIVVMVKGSAAAKANAQLVDSLARLLNELAAGSARRGPPRNRR